MVQIKSGQKLWNRFFKISTFWYQLDYHFKNVDCSWRETGQLKVFHSYILPLITVKDIGFLKCDVDKERLNFSRSILVSLTIFLSRFGRFVIYDNYIAIGKLNRLLFTAPYVYLLLKNGDILHIIKRGIFPTLNFGYNLAPKLC